MFKISSELKTIPGWFENFDPKKLIDHPVPSIKYLIWLMQAAGAIGVLVSIVGSFFTAFGGFMIPFVVGSLILNQIVILGVHARARLAWLWLASGALRMTFSMMFPLGIVFLIWIDRDEVVNYFRASAHTDEKATRLETPILEQR